MATFIEYTRAAMKHAQCERMEDGRFFATIPQFDGLWAVGDTEDGAKHELFSALDGWLDVHIKIGREHPPIVDGLDILEPPRLCED